MCVDIIANEIDGIVKQIVILSNNVIWNGRRGSVEGFGQVFRVDSVSPYDIEGRKKGNFFLLAYLPGKRDSITKYFESIEEAKGYAELLQL